MDGRVRITHTKTAPPSSGGVAVTAPGHHCVTTSTSLSNAKKLYVYFPFNDSSEKNLKRYGWKELTAKKFFQARVGNPAQLVRGFDRNWEEAASVASSRQPFAAAITEYSATCNFSSFLPPMSRYWRYLITIKSCIFVRFFV